MSPSGVLTFALRLHFFYLTSFGAKDSILENTNADVMNERSLKEQKDRIKNKMNLILMKLLISFGLRGTFFVDI